MTETRYTKDHEYVRVEGDVAVVGISDHAQQQLGDVVFVELPAVGAKLAQGRRAPQWSRASRRRATSSRRSRARWSRSTQEVDAQPA